MKRLILPILFFCAGVCSAQTANLLKGDADVEIDPSNMTNGSYSNSTAEAPKWKLDSTTGYQSPSSIKLLEFCGIGIHDVKLPAGTYTFSFWAKGSEPDTRAYITVNKQDSSWPVALKNRADSPIRLTTDWKRYSFTFTADGVSRYSPYYGIEKQPAWFDRFMLNAGDRPLDWAPTTDYIAHIGLPEADGNVYEIGKPVDIDISLTKFTEKKTEGPLHVKVIDYQGTVVMERKLEPEFDSGGKYGYSFRFPGDRSGWFMVSVSMKGAPVHHNTFVITRPPEPAIKEAEPFLGLCGGQNHIEAMKRIGVRWLQKYLAWYMMEEVKGKYDFFGFDKFREYKKQGFKVQILVTSGVPRWVLTPGVEKAAAKYGMNYPRLLPPEDKLENWRMFMRSFMKQYKDVVDIYELGGELDALLGLNTYYKSLDNKNMVGPFVLGESFDIVTKQMAIAAEEIRKEVPDARISAVRPSDVDARYAYAYSREFFKKNGKDINCFGIDCYPQPRWIGPGQPATGTEQDLAKRYKDAKAVLAQYGKGSDVYIAEYGYFIDFNEVTNPVYLQEQVNRLARSYLKAKLVGMKSLHWFTTDSTGLEGKRYHMGIWWRHMPLPAVAALNIVGRVVDNVRECAEIPFSENMGVAVYGKYDGRAVGALWSLKPDFSPTVMFEADQFTVTDVMGNPVKPVVGNGKIKLVLSEHPYYVWRTVKGEDNYSKLHTAFRKLKIEEKIPAELFFRPAAKDRLKIYMRATSLVNDNSGVVEFDCDGKKGRTAFTLPRGRTEIVNVPLPPPGKTIQMAVHFKGDYQPYSCEFTTPELIRVPRISGIRIDGSLDTWKQVKPVAVAGRDHIHPVDHTTYDGPEDLSAKFYLAHDGKYLYFAADVTDDKHFQKFPLSGIWRGDCIQLGIDPQMNFIRNVNDLDPDDSLLTVSLLEKGPALAVHRGPFKSALEKQSEYKVVRDEARKQTLYQVKMPLAAVDGALKPDMIFGFNCVVMDDDTGSGADYWLFLKQGLAGGLRPDKFAQCILEQ